jgi:hypothetical protein
MSKFKIVFTTNGAGTTEYPHAKKKKSRNRLTPFTKKTLKWTIDLNEKCKTIKILDNITGKNVDDLKFS